MTEVDIFQGVTPDILLLQGRSILNEEVDVSHQIFVNRAEDNLEILWNQCTIRTDDFFKGENLIFYLFHLCDALFWN